MPLIPDMMLPGKGLIGGYVPLAITLISEKLSFAAVCIEARRHGLLTRTIWNVVVLMPPLCITTVQLTKAVESLRASITEVRRCSSASTRKNAEEVTA
jgi:adenosylmethionine-8-amino-7-oxononanoate aminotransferase